MCLGATLPPPTRHPCPKPPFEDAGYGGQALPWLHSLWLGLPGEGGKAAPTPLPESFRSFGSEFLTLRFRAAPAQLSLRCPALGSVAKPWLWPRTSCSWESRRSACSLCPGMAQQGKNSKAGKSGAFPGSATPCLLLPAQWLAPSSPAGSSRPGTAHPAVGAGRSGLPTETARGTAAREEPGPRAGDQTSAPLHSQPWDGSE